MHHFNAALSGYPLLSMFFTSFFFSSSSGDTKIRMLAEELTAWDRDGLVRLASGVFFWNHVVGWMLPCGLSDCNLYVKPRGDGLSLST